MLKVVIDTNVLLVANQQHSDVSAECVAHCIERLQALQSTGVVVIDDGFIILAEYQNKTRINPPRGVGDVFLKWLLRNMGNAQRVEMVSVTQTAIDCYAEFPDQALQAEFDPPDRIFPAVANAHPDKPIIWQAADCKWIDWWPTLAEHAIKVEFLCAADAQRFYKIKFPRQRHVPAPAMPESK
ncbi:hypothetical protein FXF61_08485 [Pseudomonas sp. C27(2019)]|uniref:hypothetical protein n=1 Tax=Pseudomonas sp. C27(2019) TaxID=2604941 RepID=UPI001247F316|nr:hypothetical protein [Pseudomonas sp. C27(2019)]QEY59200.1 hypothetical protein FXF61_08485 [Pseudomonas sp. C27(2019)]